MGIHLTSFVVDAGQFSLLLRRPLRQILSDLRAQHVRSHIDDDHISFGIGIRFPEESWDPSIEVSIEGKVEKRLPDGSWQELSAQEMSTEPFLQETLDSYLSRGSPYQLNFLLQDLRFVDGKKCVEMVTSSYKLGWIGALLEASSERWSDQPSFETLRNYFARIIQPYSCGYPLEKPASTSDFPVQPVDSSDCSISVLSPSELVEFVELLTSLRKTCPRFWSPHPWRDWINEDWTDWVVQMISSFQEIPRLGVENPHLVSFVS